MAVYHRNFDPRLGRIRIGSRLVPRLGFLRFDRGFRVHLGGLVRLAWSSAVDLDLAGRLGELLCVLHPIRPRTIVRGCDLTGCFFCFEHLWMVDLVESELEPGTAIRDKSS